MNVDSEYLPPERPARETRSAFGQPPAREAAGPTGPAQGMPGRPAGGTAAHGGPVEGGAGQPAGPRPAVPGPQDEQTQFIPRIVDPPKGDWREPPRPPSAPQRSDPSTERLVQGRERIYLDRFYNELSADPKHIDEATRAHYAALYSRPHAIHDAFSQFEAFRQDAIDDQRFLAEGKLKMPVLAIGGEKSFGEGFANEIAFAADNVRGLSIPGSGHWLMEEQPAATMDAIVGFLREPAK